MIARRDFLRLSLSALAACATQKPPASNPVAGKHRAFGVQLYTLRDEIDRDLPGVLAAVRTIGYREVELFGGVYSHPASELRKMLADADLTAPAGHFDFDTFEKQLDVASELGLQFVVCAWLPGPYQSDLDGFAQAAQKLNLWGTLAQKRGMRLAFHNHNYEFAAHDGRTGFDVLMERTDPELVGLEFDCYWLAQAGRDPVAMIDQYKDRVRLLHLKDRKAGQATSQRVDSEGQRFLDVGAGALDWPAILAKAKDIGVEHLFVERDKGEMPAMESLRASYRYLQSLP